MEASLIQKSNQVVNRCLTLASNILNQPFEKLWIDYDREADVIYLSFRQPQKATTTSEFSEDILLRKSGKDIVGMTILNASSH